MYDINDTANVIIKIANNNDTFINQFDMQYLLLILHKTYEKIYNEYLFENTSTAKSEKPKSFLTAYPEIHSRFAAYGGISINNDVTDDIEIPIPDHIQSRIKTIVQYHIIRRHKDPFYLKNIIHNFEPMTTNEKIVMTAYNAHQSTYENDNCTIKNANVILRDIAKNAEMNRSGGKLINMWLHSSPEERQTIEKMFRLLFDETFDTFVCKIIIQTKNNTKGEINEQI